MNLHDQGGLDRAAGTPLLPAPGLPSDLQAQLDAHRALAEELVELADLETLADLLAVPVRVSQPSRTRRLVRRFRTG